MLSTDGGVGYREAARFTGVGDQPKLAVGDNSVWVVWQNSSLAGNLTAASAYFDGLGHWQGFFGTIDVPISPNGIPQNFGKISVGPNDQVMVTIQDNLGIEGPSTIWSSVDMLGTRGSFAKPRIVTTTNVGDFAFNNLVQPNRAVDAESEPAYDRSGGRYNGSVYVVYSDRP